MGIQPNRIDDRAQPEDTAPLRSLRGRVAEAKQRSAGEGSGAEAEQLAAIEVDGNPPSEVARGSAVRRRLSTGTGPVLLVGANGAVFLAVRPGGRSVAGWPAAQIPRFHLARPVDCHRCRWLLGWCVHFLTVVHDLPCLPIYHYMVIRAAKSAIQGFQPNPNMQEYTWNPNEWWIKRA